MINSIERAELSLVQLLRHAQTYKAEGLARFMLHLISTNYVPMRRRAAEWALLGDENMRHVEAHRWPPLSYLEVREVGVGDLLWLGN